MKNGFSGLIFVFFSLFFSEDFWRLVVGFMLAVSFGPKISQTRGDLSFWGEAVVCLMVLVLGWSVSAWPAKRLSEKLRSVVVRLYNKG